MSAAIYEFPGRKDSKKIHALRILRRAQQHLMQQYVRNKKWTDKTIAVAWVQLHELELEIQGKPSQLRKRGKKA